MGSFLKKIPIVGTVVNAGSAAISGVRAAMADTPEERNKYLVDAAMSAASMIPGVGTAISVAQDLGAGDLLASGITSLTGGSKKEEGGGGGGEGGGGGGDEGGGGGGGGDEGGGGGGFWSSIFG